MPADANSSFPAGEADAALSGRTSISRNILFAFATVALLVLMAGTLRDLYNYASDLDNKNASQVFLIPFVSLGLLFMNRAKIFSRVNYGVVPGSLVMTVGVALWGASRTWGPQLLEGDRLGLATSALITLWIGAFLFFYGSRAFHAAMFPLLFLVFCIPIPSVILEPLIALLRRGSAEIAYLLLKVSGTPVFRQDFIFAMPRLTINVAPECSGIRSFISMVILTIVAGNVLLESWWRRILLIVVAIPVMLFKNGLRIATLSLLTIHVDPGIIESRLHREGGIPFFVVALVLLYPFVAMLIRTERRARLSALPEATR